MILISRSLWKRWWRGNETTKASLSTCYTTYTGVHLTHLISERVKASIHALKLRHDGLVGHTTNCRGRRSRGRRNNRSCKIGHLHLWPLRSELGLTLLNKIGADGTHNGEVSRIKNGDGEVVKDPRDGWRKDALITGHHILIHIKDRCDEVRKEVNREVLKKRQKKRSTRLSDRVIVRQWSKSKCHHHVKEPQTFCKARAWVFCLPPHMEGVSQKWDKKLVSGQSPKMLTTKVVKMRYPWNM